MKTYKIALLKLRGKQSLRNRTTKILKEKYIELYKIRWNRINNIKDQLSSHWSFLIIAPLMSMLVSLCLVRFNTLDFLGWHNLHFKVMKIDLALTLLDNRINNIIAITSVSLTVIGFLFTNMQQKNKDSYNMLFKLSYFYSIIYYSLTICAILILMSTFRNSFEHWQMINITLLSVIFIILEFIFIGFLFSRIIKFTDPDSISKYSKDKLLNSIKIFVYNEKMRYESQLIVEEILSKTGKRVQSLYSSIFKNKLSIISHLPESSIIDVNISKIEECILNISNNETKDQIEFIPFYLNMGILRGFDYNYANLSEKIFQHISLQNTLSEYIYLGIPKRENISLHEIHESIYNKTISAIKSNDSETLKHNLEIYDSLYSIYFENFK